jgi:2-methylisocitrate lyase-like PEP mutase family enzyme
MKATARLRELINGEGAPLLLPGAANALTALVIQDAGFDSLYVSGAGLANTFLGVPDVGLVTLSELVDHVAAMADVVSIPILVDGDTGFGNAINVQRTVRMLERAGAAAIQLEDQVSPKKCGHFAGKDVISRAEMVGKIHAAVDARADDDFVVIARTDAVATEGMDAALERMAAYSEAGADVLFVEAPVDLAQMRSIVAQVPGHHMANMVEGGVTPLMTRAELGEAGFRIALYANAAMRGAVVGMRNTLNHLAKYGDTKEAGDLMISWSDRQGLVRKPEFDRLEELYSAEKKAIA